MVKVLLKLIGLMLILLGIYFLGKNIFFTTNPYPYWWRGITADASILALVSGVVLLFALPKDIRDLGWLPIIIGIILVFASSRAILRPTSLWQFLLSIFATVSGYRMLVTGRSPF